MVQLNLYLVGIIGSQMTGKTTLAHMLNKGIFSSKYNKTNVPLNQRIQD
jgi:hypothetical protein